jgi:GAF domain-containing protein
MDHALPLAQLQIALAEGGLHSGLEMLNKRVLHRFTVVYSFDGEFFRSVDVIDKLGQPAPELFRKVPFEHSFCQYSVGVGEFKTADSMRDARLAAHIHRAAVQSYVGLPISKQGGGLYGTFCHLDLVPQQISDEEFEFLQEATATLAQYLPGARAVSTA